jgi:hypothetical protein
MSIEAINAAWLADVRPASKKLVLLCLANMHNGQTGQLNPSVSTVAKACGMSSRQAQRQIHDLIDDGLLSVIANHNGGNPQATRRYRLNLELIHTGDTCDRGDKHDRGDTHDARGDAHDTPGVTPTTQTGDAHVTQTGKNLKLNKKRTGSDARTRAASVSCPPDVDRKVWDGFLAIRKAKRAPLSEAALDGIKLEADKAGMTLGDTLALCCTRGWQGFRADWVQGQQGVTLNKHKPARRPALDNFDAKNYESGLI